MIYSAPVISTEALWRNCETSPACVTEAANEGSSGKVTLHLREVATMNVTDAPRLILGKNAVVCQRSAFNSAGTQPGIATRRARGETVR